MLTLISVLHTENYSNHKRRKALFRCSYCNNEVERLLQNSMYESCGCATYLKARTTHGGSKSRLYQIWADMKTRCLNKQNSRYHRYGGRGITISAEWLSFDNFKKWAESNGYEDNLTIDRIDNDGSYTPENCRWVTIQVNIRNRRKVSHEIKHIPKKLTVLQVQAIRREATGRRGYRTQVAKELGVSPTLIGLILKRKIWSHI